MSQQVVQSGHATFVIRATRAGPVLCVAGAIDQCDGPRLVDSVLSLARLVEGDVVVDLTELTAFGNAAARALRDGADRLRRQDRSLRVVAASPEADCDRWICGFAGDGAVDCADLRSPYGQPSGPCPPGRPSDAPDGSVSSGTVLATVATAIAARRRPDGAATASPAT